MPEYSPAPWQYPPPRGVNVSLLLDAKSEPVCRMMSRDEERANARLIAAAPDLLEALRKLCSEAAGFLGQAAVETHGITNMRVLQGKINEGRAVIAKATGK